MQDVLQQAFKRKFGKFHKEAGGDDTASESGTPRASGSSHRTSDWTSPRKNRTSARPANSEIPAVPARPSAPAQPSFAPILPSKHHQQQRQAVQQAPPSSTTVLFGQALSTDDSQLAPAAVSGQSTSRHARRTSSLQAMLPATDTSAPSSRPSSSTPSILPVFENDNEQDQVVPTKSVDGGGHRQQAVDVPSGAADDVFSSHRARTSPMAPALGSSKRPLTPSRERRKRLSLGEQEKEKGKGNNENSRPATNEAEGFANPREHDTAHRGKSHKREISVFEDDDLEDVRGGREDNAKLKVSMGKKRSVLQAAVAFVTGGHERTRSLTTECGIWGEGDAIAVVDTATVNKELDIDIGGDEFFAVGVRKADPTRAVGGWGVGGPSSAGVASDTLGGSGMDWSAPPQAGGRWELKRL
ncbi:hypothetical protein T439DRAFT_324043 [Meredithblackwellia eburnea MCA 4105]